MKKSCVPGKLLARSRRLAALLLALGTMIACLGGCSAGASETKRSQEEQTQTPTEQTQALNKQTQTPKEETNALPSLAKIMDSSRRTWRYMDEPAVLGRIQDAAWTAVGFDDSDWPTAAGSFGAKDGKLAPLSDEFSPTVYLRHYGPTGKALPVYYFRLAFSADAKDLTAPLAAEISYDDAVIVYLNGRVIFSGNTSEGGYTSPNSYGCHETLRDPETEKFTLDPALLKEGANVLAVELHQGNADSSDIYFALDFTRSLQNDTVYLGVGADTSERLVTWRGPISKNPYVQVNTADNPTFSDKSAVYPAQPVYLDEKEGECTYRAVLTDLAPGDYLYRVADETTSDIFRFHIAEKSGTFSFLCSGDPQIINDKDTSALANYQSLAENIMGSASPRFILSLGDQADDGSDLGLYRFFTGMSLLKSVPLAPVVGNHERKYEQFSQSFFMPNMDAQTVDRSGDMSGDYWFFQDNTLFLCLNSNNTDVDAHAEFMANARRDCEASCGEPAWTVGALHYSFFSAGQHADDDTIVQGREEYPAAFEAAGVDVVFSGHDHIYTRSYPMDGSDPVGEGQPGIVYFTLGSSTGSKLYDVKDGDFDYAAFTADGEYPAMTRVDVTDTSFVVTTYQDKDGSIEILDAYTIEKES